MKNKHPYIDKFVNNGGGSLSDREYLALILSYCGNNDPEAAADRLLSVYGSFSAVIDSDPKLLINSGFRTDAAVIFRLISRLSAVYSSESNHVLRLNTSSNAKLYFSGVFTGVSEERMVLVSTDRRFRITASETAAYGNSDTLSLLYRDIADFIIRNDAVFLFIAHCHPQGLPEPSAADINATQNIAAVLSKLGTAMADHIIISKNGAYSMRGSGVCPALDQQPISGYTII